jgi:hypothetical protein
MRRTATPAAADCVVHPCTHCAPRARRKFADGFPNVFVKDATRIRNRHVAFLASFQDAGSIFEQLSVIYQLPRMFVGSFTLVLPYFPTGTAERARARPRPPGVQLSGRPAAGGCGRRVGSRCDAAYSLRSSAATGSVNGAQRAALVPSIGPQRAARKPDCAPALCASARICQDGLIVPPERCSRGAAPRRRWRRRAMSRRLSRWRASCPASRCRAAGPPASSSSTSTRCRRAAPWASRVRTGGSMWACRPHAVRSHAALIVFEQRLLAGRTRAEHERAAATQAVLRPDS